MLKYEECMKTEVKHLSAPWTRKWFPLILNDVLENVLFCAKLSSKQIKHMVPKVYALSHSYLDFLEYLKTIHFHTQTVLWWALQWKWQNMIINLK